MSFQSLGLDPRLLQNVEKQGYTARNDHGRHDHEHPRPRPLVFGRLQEFDFLLAGGARLHRARPVIVGPRTAGRGGRTGPRNG